MRRRRSMTLTSAIVADYIRSLEFKAGSVYRLQEEKLYWEDRALKAEAKTLELEKELKKR